MKKLLAVFIVFAAAFFPPLERQRAAAQQTFTNYQAASLVIGQPDFLSSAGSCTQANTNGPSYCAISPNGVLAVCNQTGARTQLWLNTYTSNGQLPDLVLGKNSFTDCGSYTTQSLTGNCNGVAFTPDGQKIIISDSYNNRVLIWDNIPAVSGEPADVVLGQTDFISSAAGTAADKFNFPEGIYVTPGGKLVVADRYNNRILIWNSIPSVNGTPANVVVGQPDFISLMSGNLANQMNQPWGVWVSPDGKLLIADEQNHRVLVFNSVPTVNNADADVVIGQTSFGLSIQGTSQTQLNTPVGVTVSPDGKVAIGEFLNHRVLIYNSIPGTNGAPADVVLGQPNFTSGTLYYPGGSPSDQNMYSPYNVSFDLYGRLFVVGRDMNRGLVFGTIPSLQAELEINMASSATTICTGTGVILTISIINNGPDSATGIISTASIPSSFNYTSSNASAGSYNPVSGYWNLNSLASGDSAVLTIYGSPDSTGFFTAFAGIIQSNQSDSNLANNGTSVDYNVTSVGLTAGPDRYLCGPDTIQLTATGSINYSWSPLSGLSSYTVANPVAYIDSTITYIVEGDSTGTCPYLDTITIYVGNDFNLTVTGPTGICPGSSAQLNADATPPDTYTYSWYPGTTLNNTTIQNPSATPALTTTYYVDVMNSTNCLKSSAITVNVSPVPIYINPAADKTSLCASDTAMIDANVSTSVCDQYTVSNIPFAPVGGTGNFITLSDDQLSGSLPIGFSFSFYCNTYTQFYISSNGYISFDPGAGAGCCQGQLLPDAFIPNDLIAFAWEDLYPPFGGTISYFTTGTAPDRKLVVKFDGIQHIAGADTVTTQLVLFETSNNIEIHTTRIKASQCCYTMGIENNNGTEAVAVAGRNSSTWVATNEGIRFTPLGATHYTTWQDDNGTIIANTDIISVSPDSTVTYYVTVTDGMACTVQDSITISGQSPLVLSASTVNAQCGNSDGSATANVSAGAPPYTYLWNDSSSQTTSTATGLFAGVYTISATDSAGCSVSSAVAVSNNGAPVITVASVTDVSCNGGNDGSATTSATGGTSPYSFLWNTSPPQADSVSTGLTAGTYALSVTDAVNCIATVAVNVDEPLPLTVFTSVTDATCNNSNGNATASVNGGTGPYNYLWDDSAGQTTATATGLYGGIYQAQVSDANSCTASAQAIVNNIGAPSLIIFVTDAKYYGWSDGSATVNATGPNAPFTYLWDPNAANQTTATATGLNAGTYYVTVTNFTGCYSIGTATVGQPPSVDVNLFGIDPLTTGCHLDTNEVITVNILNYGDTLPAGTVVYLFYSVDSGILVADSLVLSADFPTADTLSWPFPATADLSAYGTYYVTAWSVLPGDADQTNDTAWIVAENKIVCCTPTVDTECDVIAMYIDGISFAGINNSGTGCNGNPESYDFDSTQWAIVTQGLTYPVNLTPSNVYQMGFGVWIDFNHDGDFADSGEFVFSSIPSTLPVSGNISIPLWADTGWTAIRFRDMYWFQPVDTDYCSNTWYGETEDYLIYIMPPYPYDIALTAILQPEGCKLDSSEPVSLLVTNSGINTLFAGDTLFFSYAIDTSAPVNEFFILTDSLPFGATLIFTFTTTANLSATAAYNLTASAWITGDGGAMNNIISATLTNTSQPTCCTPLFTFDCISNPAYIDGVELMTINNTSSGCSGSPNNYFYYPADTAWLIQGNSFGITLTPSTTWSVGFGVWIDFNMDGDFEDSLEFVFSTFSSTTPVSGAIYIPAGTSEGLTTMRVVAIAWTTPIEGNSCSVFDYGETEDYPVYIMQPQPVDVGPTALTGPSGCNFTSNEIITIEVTNFGTNTLFAGDTITVSYSIDGGSAVIENFILTSDLTSGSTISYSFTTTADLSALTTYQLDIIASTSGDGFVMNNNLTTSVTNQPICCIPTYSIDCTSGDFIDAVVFAGISNSGTGCNGNPDNYILVTSDSAYVNLGQSYTVSLTPGASWAQGFGVWIDFNNDGDFSDSGEFVFSSAASTTTVTGTITIPANATSGTTVIRIRAMYAYQPVASDDCTQGTYGETEDYYLVIISPANNIGAIDLTDPFSACGLTASETVTVEIRNFGQDTIFGFPVSYVVNGDTVTEYCTDTIYPGGIVSYTFATTADLSVQGTYSFSVFTSLPGDPQPSNDGISGILIENKPVISLLPYIQNFDSFNSTPYNSGSPGAPVITLGLGWDNDQADDNLDWAPRSTATQSNLTGPDYDHTYGNDGNTTQGNYLFVEDNFEADPVNLLSPCVDLTGEPNPFLGFWYHSYNGSDTSKKSFLHVDAYWSGGWINDIIPPTGPTLNTQWQYAETSLLAWTGPMSIRFRVDCDNGFPYHDIGIDDFSIFNKYSVNLGNDTSVCTGQSVLLDAGFPLFSHNWSTGDTTQTISVTTTGTYWVTVADSLTSFSDTITVTVNDAMTSSVSSSNSDSCICNGTVSVNISGGTIPYTYNWSDGQSTPTATGLCGGTYQVSVTDAAGCAEYNAATITNTYTPISSSAVIDTATAGVSDGAIDLTVSDGTPPYTYSWSNGDTVQDLAGIAGGIYTVTVTDAAGCIVILTYTVPVKVTIRETVGGISMTIFPNPATTAVTVRIDGIGKVESLTVENILGQPVIWAEKEKIEYLKSGNQILFDIPASGFSEGIYNLRIVTDKGIVSGRVAIGR